MPSSPSSLSATVAALAGVTALPLLLVLRRRQINQINHSKARTRKNVFPDLLGSNSTSTTYAPEPGFHRINVGYPGLQMICAEPDIFLVRDFFTHDECDRLVAKARGKLIPSNIRGTGHGEYRTSSQTTCTQREVPTLVQKLSKLLLCVPEGLEKMNVVRYDRGAFYKEHCDEDDGPDTMNGFEESQRLVSVIVYLNDVEDGGATNFLKAGISVRPEKGTAVLHLTGTKAFDMDERTLHEGARAVDEKWIVVTWMWMTKRVTEGFLEEDLDRLSESTI